MTTRRQRVESYRASQRRYRPSRREIERIVMETIAGLPREFRARIENVSIVVREWPPHEGFGGNQEAPAVLLGLYEGTPLIARGSADHLTLPDRITIYRGPIVSLCATPADLVREVRDTVLHEIGHYFGLDDSELR